MDDFCQTDFVPWSRRPAGLLRRVARRACEWRGAMRLLLEGIFQ
jgi:hypothetical protein